MRYFFWAVIFSSLCSCGVFKKTPISTVHNENKVNISYERFNPPPLPEFIESELDMEIHSASFDQDISAKFRFKKEDTTWISITGLFGIEGARVIVIGDTFQMIDRLNRRYYKEHISKVTKLIPLPISIPFIQAMAIGVFPYKMDTNYKMSVSGDTTILDFENELYTRNCRYVQNQCVQAFEINKSKLLEWKADFYNYTFAEALKWNIPEIRNYTLKINNENIEVKSKLSNIKAPAQLEFNFMVSEKYKWEKL
jgi:hypothetical protein